MLSCVLNKGFYVLCFKGDTWYIVSIQQISVIIVIMVALLISLRWIKKKKANKDF